MNTKNIVYMVQNFSEEYIWCLLIKLPCRNRRAKETKRDRVSSTQPKVDQQHGSQDGRLLYSQ